MLSVFLSFRCDQTKSTVLFSILKEKKKIDKKKKNHLFNINHGDQIIIKKNDFDIYKKKRKSEKKILKDDIR